MKKSEKYDTLVKQLFDILDTVEENAEGNEFRPTVIRSCRTQHTMQLEIILTELKELFNGGQSIMKFTHQHSDGTKIEIEMVEHASMDNVLEEFQNFLRACGYVIEYNQYLILEDIDE